MGRSFRLHDTMVAVSTLRELTLMLNLKLHVALNSDSYSKRATYTSVTWKHRWVRRCRTATAAGSRQGLTTATVKISEPRISPPMSRSLGSMSTSDPGLCCFGDVAPGRGRRLRILFARFAPSSSTGLRKSKVGGSPTRGWWPLRITGVLSQLLAGIPSLVVYSKNPPGIKT